MGKPGFTPLMEIGKKNTRVRNPYVREAIGEFFGTLILCFMCVGSSAQFMVKTDPATGKNPFESQIVPVFGIVFGILIAIISTGGVSGAHINPSVSISLAVAGELSWFSVPGYLIGQFIGGIVGSLLAWSLVHPMIRDAFMPREITNMTLQEYDVANDLQIAGIFSPLRRGFTVANGFSTELVLTAMLMMAICGAVDKKSSFRPPKFLLTFMFPLIIAGFCFCHDLPSGTLLNPARDLGPRLAALILGWDVKYVFKSVDWDGNEQHWWIVGLFGPITGGIIGALIYSFLIGSQVNVEHLDEDDVGELPSSPYSIRGNERNQDVLAAREKSDVGTDWRSTVFVPKVPASAVPNGGYNPNNNNNNYPQQIPYGSGYSNQGHQNKGYQI